MQRIANQTNMHTNLSTLSSALMNPIRMNPSQIRIPRTGMMNCLPTARAPMAPRGSEVQRPRGTPILASADPRIINPIGELAAPKNAAVSTTNASGGCSSGAGGMFVPGTLGINNAFTTDILETMSETTADNKTGDESLPRKFTYRMAGWGWFGEEFSVDAGIVCGPASVDDCVSSHRPNSMPCRIIFEEANGKTACECSNDDSCRERSLLDIWSS
jgi:hypothetical protein